MRRRHDVELGSTRLLAEASVAIPAVSKPLHARLEAALPTSDETVRNAWDFWLFPKRDKQDGRGIAVSKDLLPALEKLYAGLAPRRITGSRIGHRSSSRGSRVDVRPALAAGKRVLLINGARANPTSALGWWWMGNQVGTAFAKHPALGDFPHDGYLSPLAFRIVKTGSQSPAKRHEA